MNSLIIVILLMLHFTVAATNNPSWAKSNPYFSNGKIYQSGSASIDMSENIALREALNDTKYKLAGSILDFWYNSQKQKNNKGCNKEIRSLLSSRETSKFTKISNKRYCPSMPKNYLGSSKLFRYLKEQFFYSDIVVEERHIGDNDETYYVLTSINVYKAIAKINKYIHNRSFALASRLKKYSDESKHCFVAKIQCLSDYSILLRSRATMDISSEERNKYKNEGKKHLPKLKEEIKVYINFSNEMHPDHKSVMTKIFHRSYREAGYKNAHVFLTPDNKSESIQVEIHISNSSTPNASAINPVINTGVGTVGINVGAFLPPIRANRYHITVDIGGHKYLDKDYNTAVFDSDRQLVKINVS